MNKQNKAFMIIGIAMALAFFTVFVSIVPMEEEPEVNYGLEEDYELQKYLETKK